MTEFETKIVAKFKAMDNEQLIEYFHRAAVNMDKDFTPNNVMIHGVLYKELLNRLSK